ncbi:MAG: hypothetical protein KDC67_11515 [Ignavibacteriae bacterium]|nr:hypothetical protein [Ignavibacteriota bacterium]MCB0748589.1 hypothetical protein [Ignavibacteriota bacterium]
MEKSKSIKEKKKKTKISKISKKNIHEYIDKKLDELSWHMGEKKITQREELYDR